MSPITYTFFAMSLGLGTAVTFASSHWLWAWIGLEINTLAILPMMKWMPHPRPVEATLKYFLVQITAAILILFGALANALATGQWHIMEMKDPYSTTFILLALAYKMGLAPLHTWMPEVIQGLDLTTGMIMNTWQKMAPFALMYQMGNQPSTLLVWLGIISIFIGAWGGLNQTQTRKIMAYSSVAHLGWLVIVLQFNPSLAVLAFGVYIAMTTTTFLILIRNQSTTLTALSSSWVENSVFASVAMTVFLSLGGLPPLTGFMPKLLILYELTNQNYLIIAGVIAVTSLLALGYYLQIGFMMILTMSPQTSSSPTHWRHEDKRKLAPLAILVMVSTMLLPLTPALMPLLSM